MSGPWHGGKGDMFRQFDRKKWDENYERIFGKDSCKHLTCKVIRRRDYGYILVCYKCDKLLDINTRKELE